MPFTVGHQMVIFWLSLASYWLKCYSDSSKYPYCDSSDVQIIIITVILGKKIV